MRRKKWKNVILKTVTAIAVLAYLGTVFYIDSDAWNMKDLYWQVPVWLISFGWTALFVLTNNRAIDRKVKKGRKAIAQKMRRAA